MISSERSRWLSKPLSTSSNSFSSFERMRGRREMSSSRAGFLAMRDAIADDRVDAGAAPAHVVGGHAGALLGIVPPAAPIVLVDRRDRLGRRHHPPRIGRAACWG